MEGFGLTRWWEGVNLRDLSCRERCSEREKARLQNWHLYRFSFSLASPLVEALRFTVAEAGATVGGTAATTADMVVGVAAVSSRVQANDWSEDAR